MINHPYKKYIYLKPIILSILLFYSFLFPQSFSSTIKSDIVTEKLQKEQAQHLADDLMREAEKIGDVLFLGKKVNIDPAQVKNLAHQLRAMAENIVVVLALENKGKVNLAVGVSDALAQSGRYHAGEIIKKITPFVKGGGGGQPQFAMAGGKDASGILQALEAAKALV